MTLRPNPQVTAQLRPITLGAKAHHLPVAFVIGIVGNVVVFIPLGMGLVAALGGRWRAAVLIGASVSFAVRECSLSYRVAFRPFRILF